MKRPTPAAPTVALVLLVALVLAGAGCGTATPSSVPTSGPPSLPASAPPGDASPVAGGPRPIVITTDMGMDDLLAIYLLLRDPAVDVRAITVDGTGLVHCGPGLRNLRRILVAFGRAEIPFACGRDDPGPDGTPFPDEWRASSDDMYGIVLPPVVGTVFPPDGSALLAETIGASPAPVTVVALGPWTTLQDLFAASPDTLGKVAGIHAMAGAIDVPGNMDLATIKPSDGVEWNVGADPDSFADVLALDVPVALVPLDATNDVPVPPDVLARLEGDHAAAGADIAYETYARNPFLSSEGNYWWDATAAASLTDPSLLAWEEATVSISDRGRISRDTGGRPARIATGADGARTQAAILAGLRRGDPRPEPFTTTGTLAVAWDGTTCRIDGEPPTKAGIATVRLANRGPVPAGMLVAGVVPPRTWPDLVAWVSTMDLSGEVEVVPPDWIVQVEGQGPFAEPDAEAVALADLPPGPVGVLCAAGQWPDLTFVDGGSFSLDE